MFSLPLLKSLRDRWPAAEIHSVVKPYLAELLQDSRFVDAVLPKPATASDGIRLLLTLRRNRYDLFISLARSEEALLLTALSKAKCRAGFARFPWDRCLDVRETVIGHNSSYNNDRLLDSLGIPRTAETYVGLLPIDYAECSIEIPKPYVVISAGASRRRLIKAWDEEKFARLITALHERYALRPVLVGAGDTKESNGLIARMVRENPEGKDIEVIDLTGNLSLRSLAALLMSARLFVGIDSGVMHLASAMNTPVAALFGPTDPEYVGPQNKDSAVVRYDMGCVPCRLKKTCEDAACMRNLDTEKVLDACVRLMEGTRHRPDKTPVNT